MEFVTEYLSQYSHAQMFNAYCILLFLTLLGTLPNNSDLTIIAGSLLVAVGTFNFYPFIAVVFALVLVTENLMFFLGYFWGNKVKGLKLVQKVFPLKKQESFEKIAKRNAFKMVFTIRLTPLFRPAFHFMLGSLRISPRKFWLYHTPIMLVYVSTLIGVSVSFGNVVEIYLNEYKEWILIGFLILCFSIIKFSFRTKENEI
jgi:membrane protein DedA with SNARE-associated domain